MTPTDYLDRHPDTSRTAQVLAGLPDDIRDDVVTATTTLLTALEEI